MYHSHYEYCTTTVTFDRGFGSRNENVNCDGERWRGMGGVKFDKGAEDAVGRVV